VGLSSGGGYLCQGLDGTNSNWVWLPEKVRRIYALASSWSYFMALVAVSRARARVVDCLWWPTDTSWMHKPKQTN
jgi:hypothetical protein